MTPDLQKYIESLPIHTYLMSSDIVLIGRLVDVHVNAVEINAVCSIETFTADDDTLRATLIPLVPLSLEQTSILYRQHIILETPAAFGLKKSYCDTLLRIKANGILNVNPSSSIDLETTNVNHPKPNPFKDRWNN